jgi:O-antigen/teichoic acid export membrane protein
MLRINLIVLVLAVLALIALGQSIELQLTGGRFADHLLLAGLMAFQLLLMSVGAALWSAYNAAGDAVFLNRVSILSSIGSIPIVFLSAYFYGAVGVAAVATVRVFGLVALLLGNFGGEPARTLLFGRSERRKFCLVLICAVISLVGVVILHGRHFQDWLVFLFSASVFGLLIASTRAIDQGELKAMNTILGASLNRTSQPRGSW